MKSTKSWNKNVPKNTKKDQKKDQEEPKRTKIYQVMARAALS